MQKVAGQSGGILRTRNQRESSLFRLSSAAILADTGRHLSLLWRRWSGRNFSSLESWSDDMQPSSKVRSLCIWGLGRFRGRVNRRLEPVWVWVAQEVGLCGRELLPSTLCTGHVFPQIIRRRGVIFTLVAFTWTKHNFVSFDSLDPTPRCVATTVHFFAHQRFFGPLEIAERVSHSPQTNWALAVHVCTMCQLDGESEGLGPRLFYNFFLANYRACLEDLGWLWSSDAAKKGQMLCWKIH